MNKQWVLFHLGEALEELQRTIKEIESEPDYSRAEFAVGIGHMYHHLNTAWNSQDISDDKASKCSQEEFDAARRFPPPEDVYLP